MQTEPPETTSLKTCIRELIKAGDSLSRWHTDDQPRKLTWDAANVKSFDLIADPVPSSQQDLSGNP